MKKFADFLKWRASGMDEEVSPQPNVAIAVDVSGSVGGQSLYWTVVEKITKKYDFNTIILWDDRHDLVNRAQLSEFISKKKGRGGTRPVEIARALVGKHFNLLIIITDGQVSSSDVRAVDSFMAANRVEYDRVECHVIDSRPDLSVTCAFTRDRTAAEVITHTPLDPDGTAAFKITERDHVLLDSIQEIKYETFMSKYDTIHSLIVNLTMGTSGNREIHTKLVQAKSRMLRELATSADDDEVKAGLIAALSGGDAAAAHQFAQQVVDGYYKEGATAFSSQMDRLITLAMGKCTAFGVDQYTIKTNAMVTGSTAVDVDIDLTQEDELASSARMEDPITFDDDIPVIVVLEGPPILEGVDKKIVDAIRRCTLSILHFPEICEKFRSRLSHAIGLASFKTIRDTTCEDPFTRGRISGCIPLGLHIDHVIKANHSLAHIMCGEECKVIGNLDLVFAVLWKISQTPGRHLEDVVGAVEQQLRFRLVNRWSYASMLGEPGFVSTRLPLGVCAWFVLESGTLRLDESVRPLRTHAFNTPVLRELVELAGFGAAVSPLTERLISYTRTMLSFLSMSKQKRANERMRSDIRSLFQNSIVVKGRRVFLDGGPGLAAEGLVARRDPKAATSDSSTPDLMGVGFTFSDVDDSASLAVTIEDIEDDDDDEDEQLSSVQVEGEEGKSSDATTGASVLFNPSAIMDQYPDMTVKELVYLSNLAKPNVSACTIAFPLEAEALDAAVETACATCMVPLVAWDAGLAPTRVVSAAVSMNTCRPFYHPIPDSTATWKEVFEQCYPYRNKFLSKHKRFAQFVEAKGHFPSVEDLVAYCFVKEANIHGVAVATLQVNVWEEITMVVADFAPVVASLSVDRFLERYNRSVTVALRVVLERGGAEDEADMLVSRCFAKGGSGEMFKVVQC